MSFFASPSLLTCMLCLTVALVVLPNLVLSQTPTSVPLVSDSLFGQPMISKEFPFVKKLEEITSRQLKPYTSVWSTLVWIASRFFDWAVDKALTRVFAMIFTDLLVF